jgi:DNA-binding NtrC family response regulator
VDDEPSVLEWLAAALEALGYHPLTASSAGEAEDLAARTPPDILLCDCTLPDAGGATLIGRIRELYPGLPCILMSGFPAGDSHVGATLPEGVRFLAKPFSLDALERTLTELSRGVR